MLVYAEPDFQALSVKLEVSRIIVYAYFRRNNLRKYKLPLLFVHPHLPPRIPWFVVSDLCDCDQATWKETRGIASREKHRNHR